MLGRAMVYREHPEFSNQEKAALFLLKVAALIQLPSGEAPSLVAPIDDATSAKKAQPFLANSENGDYLIVYTKAAQAFLYRPSTNKLVAVGPVNTTAQTQTAPPSATTPPISAKNTNATTSTSTKR
jgi:hypothetical protein